VTVELDELRRPHEKLIPDWEYVVDTLNELAVPDNHLIEKTRQMMVSWLVMVIFLHDLIFYSGGHNIVISRKEDLVDDGGADSTWESLLGKIRFMHDRLPSWLQADLDIRYCKIKNTEIDASVRGETSNPQAGRSGAWRRAAIDEASFVPRSFSIHTAIQQACPRGKIYASTPNGRNNIMGALRFRKDPPFGGFKLVRLHWTQHPLKDKAWYDEQCGQMTPDEIARELDINYEMSLTGKVYSFNSNTQLMRLDYDDNYPIYRGFDFGTGAPTAVVWVMKTPMGPRVLDSIEITGQSDEDIAEGVMIRHLSPDEHVDGWGLKEVARDCGDPSGKNRQSDLSSWFKNLRKHSERWVRAHGRGTPIKITGYHRHSLAERIKHGQKQMRHVVADVDRAITFYEAVMARQFPVDDQGRVIKDIPIEDWTKHTCDAFEYVIQEMYPMVDKESRDVPARPYTERRKPETAGLMQRNF
jgi:hypothetical protein